MSNNIASVHLCIRNDEHCPTCRKFFITLHNSGDGNIHKPGKSEWVDEWIRRRNGDKYQNIYITPNEVYNLSGDWSLYIGCNLDIGCGHGVVNIQYLLLK